VARFDRTIPPGGEGKITLQINTSRFGGSIHKTARVTTNDPKRPNLKIGLKGHVWTPVEVKPRRVYLKGVVGDTLEKLVHLRAQKQEPLVLQIEEISNPERFTANLKELEEGRLYELRITNQVRTKIRYREQVKLKTNYPEKPEITIGVMGLIIPPVEVRPKVLTFGSISGEGKSDSTELKQALPRRSVVVISYRNKSLEIVGLQVEKSLFEITQTNQQPGRVTITLAPIADRLNKGMNRDTLKIHTKLEGYETLAVPLGVNLL